jgi:hypothetical protein
MPPDDVLPVTETPQNKMRASDCCMIKIQKNISQITGCSTKNKMFSTFTLTLQKKCK